MRIRPRRLALYQFFDESLKRDRLKVRVELLAVEITQVLCVLQAIVSADVFGMVILIGAYCDPVHVPYLLGRISRKLLSDILQGGIELIGRDLWSS